MRMVGVEFMKRAIGDGQRLVKGGVLGLALLLAGAVASAGCSRRSEAAPEQGSAAASAATIAAASVENENYAARAALAGSCKKGQTCALEVVLTTKGDYHINDKYPYKFKTQDPPSEGVKYPKPVVGRDDGTFEQKKATLKVPFVVENAAVSTRVGGTFSLSVCSEANCLMDKANLEVAVKVE